MAYDAVFTVTLTPASSVTVLVDYATVDETAKAYADYMLAQGTLTFLPGETTKTVSSALRALTTGLDDKRFKLVLANARQASISTIAGSAEARISGPPTYPATPLRGRRLGILGDSIFYANHHWNPLGPSANDGSAPAKQRDEYYSTGMTGALIYANALMNNALELEAALQPNTNPTGTSPHNGYNFAVYSSQVANWPKAQDNTLNDGVLNVGPFYALQQHLTDVDLIHILGGTNDLSAGLPKEAVLLNLQNICYAAAQAGIWVFLHTIPPRSSDLLGPVNGVGGYTLAQMATIMLAIQWINQKLRDWIATVARANIWLVDSYPLLVGPTASLVPGNPTDPAGLLSSSTSATAGSTPGNYRTDAPGLRIAYDGLHFAPPGGYIVGKESARVMIAAGVPVADPAMLGPLTIGANIYANPGFTLSTTPRNQGEPLKLGRAIGLGAPIGTPAGTGTRDAHTNYGQGYAQGPVPDDHFVYRMSNSDGESYSNPNPYTYSAFPGQVPQAFLGDSTWADGCLTTSVVSVGAARGFKAAFSAPAGLSANEGFVIRQTLAPGQHNAWDNYGYEGVSSRAPDPSPPYTPGQILAFDCRMDFEGLSPNLCMCRMVANFLSIDLTNANTDPAVISSLALAESFFPFSNIENCHQHTEARTLYIRTPAVRAPTPVAGETVVCLQLNWQFSWDCRTQPGTGSITISSPRVASLTGPTL